MVYTYLRTLGLAIGGDAVRIALRRGQQIRASQLTRAVAVARSCRRTAASLLLALVQPHLQRIALRLTLLCQPRLLRCHLVLVLCGQRGALFVRGAGRKFGVQRLAQVVVLRCCLLVKAGENVRGAVNALLRTGREARLQGIAFGLAVRLELGLLRRQLTLVGLRQRAVGQLLIQLRNLGVRLRVKVLQLRAVLARGQPRLQRGALLAPLGLQPRLLRLELLLVLRGEGLAERSVI